MSLGGAAQAATEHPFEGTVERLDFGADPQQDALVYLPPATAPKRTSAIYFIHGGGWDRGNPETYSFVGRFLAERGYPTILGGYRLTPDHRFPSQLDDTTDGLRTGLDFLEDQGLPVERLILGGHSAGAQLAALMAYDTSITEVDRDLFGGLFTLSGPLDFSLNQRGQIAGMLDAYVSHLADPSAANPVYHADSDQPLSVIVIHGDQDPVVDSNNAHAFVDKLNQGPVERAQLHMLPGRFHTDLLELFLTPSTESQILTDWLAAVDQQ